MTPAELAAELGMDPRTVRRWLRQTWPRTDPRSRWEVTAEQADAARGRFGPASMPAAGTPPVVGQAQTGVGWSNWVPLAGALVDAPLLPGVYMARTRGGPVVYVCMAGERRGQGIRGRLSVYLSG